MPINKEVDRAKSIKKGLKIRDKYDVSKGRGSIDSPE